MRSFLPHLGAFVGTTAFAVSLAARAQTPAPRAGDAPATSTPPDSTEKAAQALSAAAANLEKSAKSLSDAADKAAGKPPTKTLLEETASSRRGWNGVFFKFSEKEKVGTASFTAPMGASGAWRFTGQVSAPLDEDTKVAALTDTGKASPFKVKLGVEFDAVQRELEELLASAVGPSMEWCRIYNEEMKSNDSDCPGGEKYELWAKNRAAAEGSSAGAMDGVLSSSVPRSVRWTLGIDLEASYDRHDVYGDDVAVKAEDKSSSDVKLAFVARYYPESWLALPLRLGLDISDQYKAEKARRCTALNSSEASVSANVCEDVLRLKSDSKSDKTFFAEISAVISLGDADESLAPGIEVRERIEDVGASAMNRLSATLFVSPTNAPILTRFGIGLEHQRALNDDRSTNPKYAAGDTWLNPFLVLGASL